MTMQFRICISPSEGLLDAASSRVASPLPCCHRGGQRSPVGGAARQTLPIENADLYLRHVQPTGATGRVVELDSAQYAGGGLDAQDFLEVAAQVSIEVVKNQVHLAHPRVATTQHATDETHKVGLATPHGNLGVATFAAWLDGHEDVASPGALVLVILPQRHAEFGRQGRGRLVQQLFALVVQTDHGFASIVWPSVQLEQFVHAPPILCGEFPDTPHQSPPRLEEVVVRIRRVVSRLMPFIFGSRCAACISSAIVHRCAPDGVAEQANALTSPSTSASYCLGLPRRASSRSAKSVPPCRCAARVRQIAVRPTFSTCMRILCCPERPGCALG